MADKLMYIPNVDILYITTSVNYNYYLKRLETQLNEPTNQNSILVPKVVKPTNKKRLWYKGNKTTSIRSQAQTIIDENTYKVI